MAETINDGEVREYWRSLWKGKEIPHNPDYVFRVFLSNFRVCENLISSKNKATIESLTSAISERDAEIDELKDFVELCNKESNKAYDELKSKLEEKETKIRSYTEVIAKSASIRAISQLQQQLQSSIPIEDVEKLIDKYKNPNTDSYRISNILAMITDELKSLKSK